MAQACRWGSAHQWRCSRQPCPFFLSTYSPGQASGLSRLPWVTTSGNILGSPLRVVPSGQAAWGGGAGQSKNPAACSRCHSRANGHPSRRCPGLGSLSWRGHLTACSISEAAKRRVRVKGALPNLSLSLPTGTHTLGHWNLQTRVTLQTSPVQIWAQLLAI